MPTWTSCYLTWPAFIDVDWEATSRHKYRVHSANLQENKLEAEDQSSQPMLLHVIQQDGKYYKSLHVRTYQSTPNNDHFSKMIIHHGYIALFPCFLFS